MEEERAATAARIQELEQEIATLRTQLGEAQATAKRVVRTAREAYFECCSMLVVGRSARTE